MTIQGKLRENSLFMGRSKRAAQAGSIYHVLNRANARMSIFEQKKVPDKFFCLMLIW
ncbi:hypothetical protein [uncultured Gimesia sp.]|jgi:hypothetical protein|uniref:hypothetical protein n=1 Tax=uncultured Gimesia sp. TaxID=1678688 RepID=UPI0026188881|nr:hypothetical protein [uncultured Gimesia sp.]